MTVEFNYSGDKDKLIWRVEGEYYYLHGVTFEEIKSSLSVVYITAGYQLS